MAIERYPVSISINIPKPSLTNLKANFTSGRFNAEYLTIQWVGQTIWIAKVTYPRRRKNGMSKMQAIFSFTSTKQEFKENMIIMLGSLAAATLMSSIRPTVDVEEDVGAYDLDGDDDLDFDLDGDDNLDRPADPEAMNRIAEVYIQSAERHRRMAQKLNNEINKDVRKDDV